MTSNAVGWWQQAGFGRQPMHELVLSFTGDRIHGGGIDIVAPFELEGRVRKDGSVEIIKQYIGLHKVIYVGQYDGEGTLYGTWDINGHQGKWSIKLLHPAGANDLTIQEVAPL
ncbi:MAG: hypothetical protein R3C53_23120 [Pirellulaceae bacterium]